MLTTALGSLPPIVPPSVSGGPRPGSESVPSAVAEVAPGSGSPGRAPESSSDRGVSESQKPPESGPRREKSEEQGLSEEELSELTDLKARDREVRAHETAHQAVGGQYAGSVSYVYQRGPDGAQYAVGGEVSIDVSPVTGDPQATIEKMRVVRAAALAPAQPSGQDRAVAAEAMQQMLQAQTELAQQSGQESGQPESAEPEAQAENAASPSARDAANTYQSVSALASGPDRSPTPVLDAIA